MYVENLVEKARSSAGVSWYRLARVLGVTDGTVTNWRKGTVVPNDAAGRALAEMAGMDAGAVLVTLAALRSQDETVKAVWTAVAQRLASGATVAGLALFCTVGGGPDAMAGQTTPGGVDAGPGVCYVNRRRAQIARIIARLNASICQLLNQICAPMPA